MSRAVITITLDMPGDSVSETVRSALDSLADVMHVQAEDGLYTLGSPDPDDSEHLLDFDRTAVAVTIQKEEA